jgi:hypothetical protein
MEERRNYVVLKISTKKKKKKKKNRPTVDIAHNMEGATI